MSTTIKRIALVAVAALGLGVVSVAPSQATAQSVTLTVANGTATTLKQDTTTAASIGVAALLSAGLADTVTVSVIEKTVPATSVSTKTLLGYLETTTQASRVDTSLVYGSPSSAKYESVTASDAGALFSVSSATNAYVGANFTLQLKPGAGTIVAGTYTYTVIATPFSAGVEGASVSKDVSIVVTAPSTKADATSVGLLTAGNTIDPAAYITAGITADSVTVGSKAATTAVGVIYVKQKNADATAVPAEDVNVSIAGPGTLKVGSLASITAASTGTGRAVTATATDYIGVFADGTSGVATVTVTGQKSGVVLASKTITFFDTKPASATVAVKKAYVLASTDSTADVFLVTVKDSAGNPIKDITSLTGAPTDTATTQVVGGAATCSTTYNATKGGFYCSVVGKSATKFGKVNYTFVATGNDTDETVVKATADITFSSAIAASITIVPSVTTANPGDIVTYTYTATDANGYAVPDASYNTQTGSLYPIFASVVASGFSTAPFAVGDTITTVNGVATSKGTLNIAGTAKITWTLKGSLTTPADTTSIAKAIAGTDVAAADVTISNPGVDAATDAANEAAQAASDATDAALAAADAADAATTKAQEAVDAVATLSAEVSKLITALKAQITTLTNLVIKIQKKVKA